MILTDTAMSTKVSRGVPVGLDGPGGVKITRAWAMPNRYTFGIAPIAALLLRYGCGAGWVDPFAGFMSPAEITNDLEPTSPAKFHLDARDFAAQTPGLFRGVLFDPPYSNEQISRSYKNIGRRVTSHDTQNGALYSDVRDLLAPKILLGGIAISFGWNTTGFGRQRGFIPLEYLIVCHGGAHNDTLITVEQKRIAHMDLAAQVGEAQLSLLAES